MAASFHIVKSWNVLYWERGNGRSYITVTRIAAGSVAQMRLLNKMVRRKVKGTNFDGMTDAEEELKKIG